MRVRSRDRRRWETRERWERRGKEIGGYIRQPVANAL